MKLHILNTTLSIHEHSLSPTDQAAGSDASQQVQRIESLWVCLRAVQGWFDAFFSVEAFPLSCYAHVSMAIFSQLARCLVTLYNLSTLAAAAGVPWDRQRVRQELDLGDVIRRIAERWDRVLPAAGIEHGPAPAVGRYDGEHQRIPEDPWSNTKRKVAEIGRWWEAKVAAISATDAAGMGDNGPPEAESVMSLDAFNSGQPQMNNAFEFEPMDMDTLDDSWLRDLLGGGHDFNLAPYL